MDSGCFGVELDSTSQLGRHGISIDDGARIKHGGSRAYRLGSDRSHGMRGDRLGVGDVGQKPGGAWDDGLKTGCNHNRAPERKHERGLVRGRYRTEHYAPRQQSWIGIGIDDGARGKHGRSRLHDKRSTRTHGVRGDGLGVGDLGEVPCGAWGRRHSSCCGDSGRAARKLESGMDSGCIRAELDASRQPRRHRIGIDDGARVRHGGSRAYRPGSDRTHGMRGDGLGVGDVGEVPRWARIRRQSSDCDDFGAAGRKRI